MNVQANRQKCVACRDGERFPIAITMAFQPIVSTVTGAVFAYEALVRPADGGGAAEVFAHVAEDTRYIFDQTCRRTAIELAARLGLHRTDALLSINFLPNAVYNPVACIRVTLDAADRVRFPTDRIMFEFTESERFDPGHLLSILEHYRALGFRTAIDDFGAGYAGIGVLTGFVPEIVKLDMQLVRGCDKGAAGRKILDHTISMLQALDVTVIAEGVETKGEYDVLRDLGVDLMQGYLFAKPAVAALPEVQMP